jgi:hypothetical protein
MEHEQASKDRRRVLLKIVNEQGVFFLKNVCQLFSILVSTVMDKLCVTTRMMEPDMYYKLMRVETEEIE